MSIKWRDSFSVGVKTIDDQHREFIDLHNRLCDALGDSEASKRSALKAMIKHVIEHFAAEERMLQHFGYDDYASEAFAEHVMEHNRLRDALIDRVTEPLTEVVANTLLTMLFEHMVGWDMRYKSYIMDKIGAGR